MFGKENGVSQASQPAIDEKNLEEAMEILFSHQKTCEKSGKYLEAEAVKKRLMKAKGELERQRRVELVQRFEEERAQVDAAHLEQTGEFNRYWDNKEQEYADEAERLESEAIERHSRQAEEFVSVVQQSIPVGKRETSEIINLRKMEEQLARQQDYVGAHKVQKQIAGIQRKENEKWQVMRNSKIRSLIVQLNGKKEAELAVLRQKITQGHEQQQKLRKMEEQKLVQKFCNFMKELQNKHNQEIIKLDKSFKIQSNISFSRSQATSRVLQNRN